MNGSASGPEQDGWHLAVSHGTTDSPDAPTFWRGGRGALAGLAFKTGVLTILTLGIYRFWQKTRLRRWYWSAIRPDGLPLEYVGQPLEKLMGFLVAVVILAFYLGVVNLLLMFFSFSLLAGPAGAYVLSFVGVIPIWFFAQYRARRYVLARTRWRGVRFGVLPGAWGYAGRAMIWWLGTIITFGALHPRQRFALEKFKIDRTVWGSVTLQQGGERGMLYPAYAHVLIGGALSILPLLIGVSALEGTATAQGNENMLWLMLIGVPWLFYGLVHYDVVGRRLLANRITTRGVGGGIGLRAEPQVRRMVGIIVGGNILRAVATTLPIFVLAVLFGVVFAALGASMDGFDDPFLFFESVGDVIPTWSVFVVLGIFYFSIFVIWNVLTHLFITMPMIRHYAQTLTVTGADALEKVVQRDRDEFAEAEGFAEALDVGAAI